MSENEAVDYTNINAGIGGIAESEICHGLIGIADNIGAARVKKALDERGGSTGIEETLGFLITEAEAGLEYHQNHCFTSINQVLAEVEGHNSATSEDGRHLRNAADWVLEHGDDAGIQAPPEAWHRLVSFYMNAADYPYALKLADHALGNYPADLLLLGDAIWAAGESGNWNAGERHIETAKKTEWNFENSWYAAVHAGGFYMNRASACRLDESPDADAQPDADKHSRSSALKKGIDIIDACLKHFPLEERLYNMKAQLLIADNQIAKARTVLEKAILGKHKGNDGSPRTTISAPQCCSTYLEHILDNTTDYEKIQEVAAHGIQSCAVSEGSSDTGYFLYRQALAMDALIHEDERLDDRTKGFANEAMVRKTLEAYRLAFALSESPRHRSVIEKRFAILCVRSGIDDIQLHS